MATATLHRFTERTTGRLDRIDREAGVLYGVALLGRHSKNGREYTEDAMRRAVPKYNGKKLYIDHPERSKLDEDRKFDDWIGVARHPRYVDGYVRADVHLRTKSPRFEQVIEAAEKFHDCFGCSHIADGESHSDRGRDVIDEITNVFSIDVVMDPATVSDFMESDGVTDEPSASQRYESIDALCVEMLELHPSESLVATLKNLRLVIRNLQDQEALELPNEPVAESYRRGAGHEFYAPWMREPSEYDTPGSWADRYR